tara:strand:+ start:5061 stop:5930 length:870 start_codon:yes stop_codon:yes gene_type:complete
MNVLSLFDGMSCGQIALDKLGIKVDNYFACEIDKWAMKVTNKNFPDTTQLGSVTDLHGVDILLPKIDLLIGGSPCQGFSFAGKQLNFEDPRSKLFFEFVRILEEARQVNPDVLFMLENVRMKKEYQDIISKYLGVQPIMINSALVSAQNRRRLYWTNIPNAQTPENLSPFLKDIMLKLDDPLMDLRRPTQKRLDYCQRKVDKGWLKTIYKDSSFQFSDCLLASMYKRMQEFIWKDESEQLRFFTPVECERLQTVPDNYTKGVSNTQRYKMLGNGWTVDVIAHIFKNMKM